MGEEKTSERWVGQSDEALREKLLRCWDILQELRYRVSEFPGEKARLLYAAIDAVDGLTDERDDG